MAEGMTDENADSNPKYGGEIPSLRTYRHDVAESLQGESQGVITSNIQKEIKRDGVRELAEHEENANRFLVIGIIVLVSIRLTVLPYVFFFHKTTPVPVVNQTTEIPAPLILVEARTRVNLDQGDVKSIYRDIVNRVRGAGLSPNTIEEIIPEKTPLAGGQALPVGAETFINDLGIKAPEKLLRFIEREFMFGIYTLRETGGFFLFKPTSFGPVFAELLAWEDQMPNVFYPLLSGKQLPGLPESVWKDEVIKNIDVRSYKNTMGEYLLVYGFLPDKKILIIASGLDTLNEIILRSQAPKPIQK